MANTKRATKSRTPAAVPAFVEKATGLVLLNNAIREPGTLYQPRNVAHVLSPRNKGLVYMQEAMNGIPHGITATYDGWKVVGRHVRRNEKGMWVLAPTIRKVDVEQPDGTTKKEPRCTGFHHIKSRFNIHQTDGEEVEFPETVFDLGALLCTLNIEMVAFEDNDERCGGYCYGTPDGDFLAINPLWPDPLGVLFHEIGHIVAGHTAENVKMVTGPDRTPRNIRELVAEGINLVLQDTLGNKEQSASRGYIQNWNIDGLDAIPERVADDILDAGDIIYRAGLGETPRRIRLKEYTEA